MASALYAKGKQGLLDGTLDLDTHNLIVFLMDTASYTYASNHSVSSEISGGTVASASMANMSVTDGVFDADDTVLSSVTGNACEALIIVDDTATDDRLVCYIDGFTVTPNGGNITIEWDSGANKIFSLG